MSVETLALVLNHSQAGGSAKLVLVGIANHDGDGGSWPAVSTLQRYANVDDERTVQRALRKLVAMGELRVHYQAGGTANTPRGQRTNLYEILVRCPPECDRTAQHRLTRPVDNRGGASATPGASVTPGVAPVSPGGVAPVSPKPSLEPSMNSSGVDHSDLTVAHERTRRAALATARASLRGGAHREEQQQRRSG